MIGRQIFLRALEPADVDTLYEWENDTSVWHLSNTYLPFSRFALEQYIMSSDMDIFAARQLRLMIVRKESAKPIGTIDLFDFEPFHRRAGLGIMLRPEARGKGLASECIELIVEYSFQTLNLHQLYCNIAADNDASLRLFKKFGFQPTGLKKDWLFIRQNWVDEYLLQLINTDNS